MRSQSWKRCTPPRSMAAFIGILLLSAPSVAAPPAHRPDACARTFCLQIVTHSAMQVESWAVSMDPRTSRQTITATLANGARLVATARPADDGPVRATSRFEWRNEGGKRVARGCLPCSPTERFVTQTVEVVVSGGPAHAVYGFTDVSLVGLWSLSTHVVVEPGGHRMAVGEMQRINQPSR